MSHELAKVETNAELYRASTDAAGLCKAIVLQTACVISQRKYIKIEGWNAIALAHGCVLSARDVKTLDNGWSAIGEVRRMSDGVMIAQAEGFVGKDEPMWAGGESVDKWGKKKVYPPRGEFACRAMAQTRACSRVARAAFAHVVVMMNAGLETTPAEEMMGVVEAEVGPAIDTPPPPTASKAPVGANSAPKAETPPPARKAPPVAPSGKSKAERFTVVDTVSLLESKETKAGVVWSYVSTALPGVKMGCFENSHGDVCEILKTADASHDPVELTYEESAPYNGQKQAKIVGAKFV